MRGKIAAGGACCIVARLGLDDGDVHPYIHPGIKAHVVQQASQRGAISPPRKQRCVSNRFLFGVREVGRPSS
jgi:hypothetical protein